MLQLTHRTGGLLTLRAAKAWLLTPANLVQQHLDACKDIPILVHHLFRLVLAQSATATKACLYSLGSALASLLLSHLHGLVDPTG